MGTMLDCRDKFNFDLPPSRFVFEEIQGKLPEQAAEKEKKSTGKGKNQPMEGEKIADKATERLNTMEFLALKAKLDEIADKFKKEVVVAKDGSIVNEDRFEQLRHESGDVGRQLNAKLNLGLDEFQCEAIRFQDGKFVFHSMLKSESGGDVTGEDTTIYIDSSFKVEKRTKDLKTGQIKIEKK